MEALNYNIWRKALSEVKWIKLHIGMFDDEKIRIISTMPNGNKIILIWIRILIQAGKTNDKGLIYLTKGIPYNPKLLCTLWNVTSRSLKSSLEVLEQLEMIKVSKDGVIKVINWEKHQNITGLDKIRQQTRERVKKHRAKNKGNKSDTNVTQNNVTVTKQKEDKEEDRYINISKEKRKDVEKIARKILEHYEVILGKGMSITNTEMIEIINEYGEKAVGEAIDIAIKQGKPVIAYVKGILKNLNNEGYQKVEEVSSFEGIGSEAGNGRTEIATANSENYPVIAGEERQELEEGLL